MNALLEDFKFDKLKDYIKDLEKYMQENIKDAEVRKKALAKLQEFDNNTEDIDESINRLAAHILGDEL
jgi:hypothetical protein